MAPTPTLPRKPGEGEDGAREALFLPPVQFTGGIAYANLGPGALPILPQN